MWISLSPTEFAQLQQYTDCEYPVVLCWTGVLPFLSVLLENQVIPWILDGETGKIPDP